MVNRLVSIIIPSFNSLKYLDDSIKSAIDQTYKNIEIILVDDGSTDGTKERFAHFESLGVKCIYQENAGASTARNTGLDAAKGEYIQFLDADDIMHPTKIEKQIDKILLENAELSYTYWKDFKSSINENVDFRFKHLNHNNAISGKELLISYGKNNWFIPTSSWLVSAELINKSGYWNIELSNNDDGEFFTRILLKTTKVVAVKEILTYYRVSDNSLSSFNSKNKAVSAYKSWNLILSHINNSGDNSLLIYPKRGMYYLYNYLLDSYPEISELIYSKIIEIDKTEPGYTFIQDKWRQRCIRLMGMKNGNKLFRVLQFFRYMPPFNKG